MSDNGAVCVQQADGGISTVEFSHPKANSLPKALLIELEAAIEALGHNPDVRVIALKSGGEKAFCAGASFDEFQSLSSVSEAADFFLHFGKLCLAMMLCPKLIVTRVQGKAVGGGLGVISASDYVLAEQAASVRLSEFSIGIGPLVIAPFVERKIGLAHYQAAAIDTDWRSSQWGLQTGLFSRVESGVQQLDAACSKVLEELAGRSPAAATVLKQSFFQSTSDLKHELKQRAQANAELLMNSLQVSKNTQ